MVSIISALLAPNEFVAPGEARVNVAAFPAASLIVPLFKARELPTMMMPSCGSDSSAATIVYLKTSVEVSLPVS